MFRSDRFRIAGLALALAGLSVAAPALAEPSNKWRIQISSDADSDGVIVFEVAPVNGPVMRVPVTVPDDTGENDIADLVAGALRAQLAASHDVEVDDGEDVLVKKRFGGADFDLRVVQKSVRGVRIKLDRE